MVIDEIGQPFLYEPSINLQQPTAIIEIISTLILSCTATYDMRFRA